MCRRGLAIGLPVVSSTCAPTPARVEAGARLAERELEDCPRAPPLASTAEEIEHMDEFLEQSERDARTDRERCRPALRRCHSACASYAARCSPPYHALDGCIPHAFSVADEFCQDSCEAGAPYLRIARYFDTANCDGRASSR
jgi:hypothetical protein